MLVSTADFDPAAQKPPTNTGSGVESIILAAGAREKRRECG
jgi:hypothetical protein